MCLLLGISLGLAFDYLLELPFEHSKAEISGLVSVDEVSRLSVGPGALQHMFREAHLSY